MTMNNARIEALVSLGINMEYVYNYMDSLSDLGCLIPSNLLHNTSPITSDMLNLIDDCIIFKNDYHTPVGFHI